jgi:hypothetical protein
MVKIFLLELILYLRYFFFARAIRKVTSGGLLAKQELRKIFIVYEKYVRTAYLSYFST